MNKSNTYYNIFFSIYYFILIGLILYIFHKNDPIPSGFGVNIFSNAQSVIDHFSGSDYASFVKGAMLIKDNGIIAYANSGFRNWAPGVSFIDSLVLGLNPNYFSPFILLVITCGVWSITLSILTKEISSILGLDKFFCLAAVSAALLSPLIRDFFLWDAILLAESISIAFFIIGVVLCYKYNIINSQIDIFHNFIVGLCFSLAAYMRAQYDIIFIVFMISYPLFVIIQRYIQKTSFGLISVPLCNFFVVILVFIVITTPYRLLMKMPLLVENSYVWQMVWHNKAWFEKSGGEWILNGGVSVLCEVNPVVCNDFMKRESLGSPPSVYEGKKAAFVTIVNNPLTYASRKIPYFYLNWMNDLHGATDNVRLFNWLLLIIFPLSIVSIYILSVFERKIVNVYHISYFFVVLTVGSLGFSYFIHVEPRYMTNIKFFVVLTEVFTVAYFCQRYIKDFMQKNRSLFLSS